MSRKDGRLELFKPEAAACGARFHEGLDVRWHGASIHKEHWHFHWRLFERYGVVLAPAEFSQMAISIRKSRALVVEHRRNGQKIYSIFVRSVGTRIYVLATKQGRIITALPPSKRLNSISALLLLTPRRS